MPAQRRPWGWHRLDDAWARRVVAQAGIGRADLVLDVGAGTGSLTAPLVAAGARVIAVELHRARAASLRARFACDRVIVVQADAADLRLPRRPFRVVANPPFAVTTALVGRLVAAGSRLERADLILQRGAAERIAAGGLRGASRWAAAFDVMVEGPIPRSAFRPRAPYDCALLVIRRSRSVGPTARR